jgi:hypothetical protein
MLYDIVLPYIISKTNFKNKILSKNRNTMRVQLNSAKYHEREGIFCVVITEEYNVTVNSDELIRTTENVTL